jgi:cytochrome b subunit of formate dehydrogenase
MLWHILYLLTPRGRKFFADMLPRRQDLTDFFNALRRNFGGNIPAPRFGRFGYVEKGEYWALVWGATLMLITGLCLWFDNIVAQNLSKGFVDVMLVIHYYEAWLATLAILIWHMYATVFSPHVYPMNPAWITGRVPADMYRHEHPADESPEIEN